MSELYQYRGWDRAGRPVRGTVEVEDGQELDRVAWRLRIQGLFVTSLEPVKDKVPFFSLSFSRTGPLSPKELAVFCRQFGIMLSTGMSVVASLRVLANQQTKPGAKSAIERVIRRVSGGDQLSSAFRRTIGVFPRMFVDMLEVGEKSGNLPAVLERLSIFYEREAKLRGDIKQALTYPTVIFFFALAATAVILFVILPIFAEMFADLGAELPWITRMVLGVRETVARYYLIIVPTLILGVWGLFRWMRTEAGRMATDGFVLRLPIAGPLASRVIFSRFARTLSVLFSSGVSMDESLASCQRVVGNRVVASDIAAARRALREGRGLAEPLRDSKTFPPMLVEMINVGEETGNLETVLSQVSTFYEQEVEQAVRALSSVLEPIIMAFLAIIVAIVLTSVFLPLFQVVQVIA